MSAFWRKREVIPWVSRFTLIPPWGEAVKKFNRGRMKKKEEDLWKGEG
jgi:hypothetical protein